MTTVWWLQLVGTVGIATLAGTIGWIGLRAGARGRGTLATVGVFLWFAVGVRVLTLGGVLSQTDARVANGLGAWFFLAVVWGLLWLNSRRPGGGKRP